MNAFNACIARKPSQNTTGLPITQKAKGRELFNSF